MKLYHPSQLVSSLKLNLPVTTFQITEQLPHLFFRVSQRLQILFTQIVSLTLFRFNSFIGIKVSPPRSNELRPSFFVQTRQHDFYFFWNFLAISMGGVVDTDSFLSGKKISRLSQQRNSPFYSLHRYIHTFRIIVALATSVSLVSIFMRSEGLLSHLLIALSAILPIHLYFLFLTFLS